LASREEEVTAAAMISSGIFLALGILLLGVVSLSYLKS
jgi:hypothetical protein